MKKLILSLTLAGAAALAAKASTVSSANTFGVLKVASTTSQTVICVPWVAVGATDADIAVSDLVMTSNLTEGDTIYFYDRDSQKYKAWVLQNDKTWAAPKMVEKIGEAINGDTPQTTTATRGDALILVRQHPEAGDIYLYGQYSSEPVASQTLTSGAWNLVAPPNKFSGVSDLNVDFTWEHVNDADTIRLQNNGFAITLVRHENKWAYKSGTNYYEEAAQLQPGNGFWYVSTGSDDPVVTFSGNISGNN